MNRLLATCLVSFSLAALPIVAAADSKPDATIDISGNTVGVGVGFTDAKGTLHYEGKSYPVQIKGVGVAQVGISTMTATGEVFNLKQVQGINGNYTAATAGAALASGGTESTMKNQNGVVIKMHATNAGVDLRLSIDGVSVKVSQ
ncbi:MAG TPA: hypothetical protein VGG82_00525 [Casimicrobiaceae bacterium]|jgi:hypothetical protein